MIIITPVCRRYMVINKPQKDFSSIPSHIKRDPEIEDVVYLEKYIEHVLKIETIPPLILEVVGTCKAALGSAPNYIFIRDKFNLAPIEFNVNVSKELYQEFYYILIRYVYGISGFMYDGEGLLLRALNADRLNLKSLYTILSHSYEHVTWIKT